MATDLHPLLRTWKPKSDRELQAKAKAMDIITQALETPLPVQARGRITAGDATLRTLTLQVEGEIPVPMRTLGQPAILTLEATP
ncbi:hypothetical protein BJP27_24505 (plasmid) [Pseudomonas oryzihabitans]|nr:hypothetical protein BJP27_23855 [Pseudomonas psychrotolerans]APQ14734.1 hypothetical protein BJP27_24505 [Pseudomonas psychrotolerans]